jgi:uncharacterized protein
VRIGVIADTHLRGFDETLKQALMRPFGGVDLILHAGDLTDLAVLEMFEPKEVRAVWGNTDPPKVRSFLPGQVVLEINGFRLGLVHAGGVSPWLDGTLEKRFGRMDCLVFGHTHRPCNRVERGVLWFNPGSATDNRYFPFNSVGVLEIQETIRGEIIELCR